MAEWVEVLGVRISETMPTITHGRKYPRDGRWILATLGGREFAKFGSEAELDAWWLAFHEASGTTPTRLRAGRCPRRPAMASLVEAARMRLPVPAGSVPIG